MPDIALITTTLSSIKTATDIARLLSSSSTSLERAELKLKLADLIGELANARIQLSDLQELIESKEKRIQELEEAFETKDVLMRYYDAYYAKNKKGKPTGPPYCIRCWENDHKKRQLVTKPDNKERVCPTCSHPYHILLSNIIAIHKAKENKKP